MIKLQNLSTRAPEGVDKLRIKEETGKLLDELNELQNLLYAEGRRSLLVILQGMDASGKDGVIRKVFGRLNPQGVRVHSFKVPTAEEKAHDFLWRVHAVAPAKGMIQVFNRSHYEEVLITRVHGLVDDRLAEKKFAAINHFESLLREHNDTAIFKFYLHISPEEQKLRLEERKVDPTKHWKFNPGDEEEAKHWDRYRQYYEEAFARCSDPAWHIIPADQNWYKEYLISRTLAESMRTWNMQYPGLPEGHK